MKNLEKEAFSCDPNDQVSETFERLLVAIEDFTRRWAKSSWEGVSSHTLVEISKVFQNTPFDAFSTKTVFEAIEQGRVPPRILLTALVNELLCYYTFINPFDVPRNNVEGSYKPNGLNVLGQLIDFARRCNILPGC